jgi:two-component system, NarL family, response regulator LiaR
MPPKPQYDPTVAIRMAVVNDYEVVVHGVAAMLRSYTERIEVVELDADSSVVSPVDIALYDTFAQPQGDHESVARLVANPRVGRVVVYTWNLDPRLERASLKIGASGYLSKRLTASELVDALEVVHQGTVLVSEDDASRSPVGGDWPGREEGLTPRESEVLSLITQGLSNKEILSRTGLSINSIKSYIRSCYRKIEVTSRSRAVLWGIDHGFQPDRIRTLGPEIPGAD